MARFDVHRLKGTTRLVVDVQASFLADIGSRVVIPLSSPGTLRREALPRLYPLIDVGGEDHVLVTPDLAAVLDSELGAVVANVEAAHRDDVTRALDFLFQGY